MTLYVCHTCGQPIAPTTALPPVVGVGHWPLPVPVPPGRPAFPNPAKFGAGLVEYARLCEAIHAWLDTLRAEATKTTEGETK